MPDITLAEKNLLAGATRIMEEKNEVPCPALVGVKDGSPIIFIVGDNEDIDVRDRTLMYGCMAARAWECDALAVLLPIRYKIVGEGTPLPDAYQVVEDPTATGGLQIVVQERGKMPTMSVYPFFIDDKGQLTPGEPDPELIVHVSKEQALPHPIGLAIEAFGHDTQTVPFRKDIPYLLYRIVSSQTFAMSIAPEELEDLDIHAPEDLAKTLKKEQVRGTVDATEDLLTAWKQEDQSPFSPRKRN